MRIQAMTAGSHVELPSMPRTRDNLSAQLTIRERPPCVRADPIHRMEFAVRIEQSDDSPRNDEFSPFSNRHIRNFGNSVTGHDAVSITKSERSNPSPPVPGTGFTEEDQRTEHHPSRTPRTARGIDTGYRFIGNPTSGKRLIQCGLGLLVTGPGDLQCVLLPVIPIEQFQ